MDLEVQNAKVFFDAHPLYKIVLIERYFLPVLEWAAFLFQDFARLMKVLYLAYIKVFLSGNEWEKYNDRRRFFTRRNVLQLLECIASNFPRAP